jgi:hypothetical protein
MKLLTFQMGLLGGPGRLVLRSRQMLLALAGVRALKDEIVGAECQVLTERSKA